MLLRLSCLALCELGKLGAQTKSSQICHPKSSFPRPYRTAALLFRSRISPTLGASFSRLGVTGDKTDALRHLNVVRFSSVEGAWWLARVGGMRTPLLCWEEKLRVVANLEAYVLRHV